MKRLIVGGLSILLMSAAVVPAARAEVLSGNNDTQMDSTSKQVHQITPFNLVYRAYRGEFSEQGIPSYTRLLTAYETGEISAEDLVESAVNANRLPASKLSDESYLSAVQFFLRDLSRIDR
jgi:hypothetical protein